MDTIQPITLIVGHMTITTTYNHHSDKFLQDRTKCSKLTLILGSQAFLFPYKLTKIQIPGTLNDFVVKSPKTMFQQIKLHIIYSEL